VSSSISCENVHAFPCHTSLSHASSQDFQADSPVVGEQIFKTHGPVLEMQGLVCQSMARSSVIPSDKADDKRDEQLRTKIEWAPDLSFRQPKTLLHLKKQHSNSEDKVDRELVIRLRRVYVYFCHDTLQGLTAKDIAQL
jgi:hypothetical protein